MLIPLLWAVLNCHLIDSAQIPSNKTIIKRRSAAQTPAHRPQERRLSFDDELQTGSLYAQQLESTNANMNEMTGHSRLQSSMKKIGQMFGDVEERLDDFRDSVARKLNELHMSLQRPKVPIMGPAAMMLHPSMNPVLPSSLANPNASFMPNTSFLGPANNSVYEQQLFHSSQLQNATIPQNASAIQSSYQSQLAPPPGSRMLYQVPARGVKAPKVL